MSSNPGLALKAFAVTAIGAGVMVFGGTHASAAGPAASVSPASGLSDQDSVTVTGSGFPADERVGAIQCNTPSGQAEVSCNLTNYSPAVADAEGAFTATLTVRAAFDGVDPVTGEANGRVDCSVAPGCTVMVGSQVNPNVFAAPVSISFGS